MTPPEEQKPTPSAVEQMNALMERMNNRGVLTPYEKQIYRPPHNIITGRHRFPSGKWYFVMGDGSLIKPETAVKRGLVDAAALAAALKDEQERAKAAKEAA